jgi:hypothetical protein
MISSSAKIETGVGVAIERTSTPVPSYPNLPEPQAYINF